MDHLRSHVATRFSTTVTDPVTGREGDPPELVFEIGRVGQPPMRFQLSRGTVQRDGPGRFHVDFVMKEPGQWGYHWRVMGATVAQTPEVRFIVDGVTFL